MTEIHIEPNEDRVVTLQTTGRERHQVIIIDNFLKNPEVMIEHAATEGKFKPETGDDNYYPGLRAPLPRQYTACFYSGIYKLLLSVFNLPDGSRAKVGLGAYSIVTTPPDALNIRQSIPHFDTAEANQFAVVYYLFNADFGGTSFYRHRDTGFETITPERSAEYVTAMGKLTDDKNIITPGYVNGDTNLFERTVAIEAKFNRAVIYRSYLLHSGNINPDQNFSADPRAGRLTATMFIQIVPNLIL